VSLVLILHPHNQPFLPSDTSLIQTIPPPPPNHKPQLIIYPHKITHSIQYPIHQTQTPTQIQIPHNKQHPITP
ncbi:P-loop NTPase family protein, partial [Staphylococcus epidermidis]